MMKVPEDKIVVLFDGHCVMCSGLVRFLLMHDHKKVFMYAPLSGNYAAACRQRFQIPDEIDSVIVIQKQTVYMYADAVLKLAKEMGGVYHLLQLARILPKAWRNGLYRWVARNRTSWFGRQSSCFVPSNEERVYFLD